MKVLFVLLILTFICVGGCAKHSGILLAKDSKSLFDDAVCKYKTRTISEDTTGSVQYRVYQEAASSFAAPSIILEEVHEQAKEFCEKEDKEVKVLNETNPSFEMGCFTKAELVFICAPKTQASPTANFEDVVYIKLTNLKKLLDNGTITKNEFEEQKSKILNQK